MTPLIRKLILVDPEKALSHTWFDIGDFILRPEPDSLKYLDSHLPFKRCAICCRWDGTDFVAYFTEVEIEGVTCFHVVSHAIRGKEIRTAPGFTIRISDRGIQYKYDDNSKSAMNLVLSHATAVLVTLFDVINKEGYRAEIQPIIPGVRRKTRNGKPVLMYDWHTVEIKPREKNHNAYLGGTHASPRQHIRRGHWRTYNSGKKVWVHDHSVGDAALGTVFKDYKCEKSS